MPNTFITPSIVAQEALMILSNELVVANTVYRGYESEYTNAKVGDTIKIRRPAAFDTNLPRQSRFRPLLKVTLRFS